MDFLRDKFRQVSETIQTLNLSETIQTLSQNAKSPRPKETTNVSDMKLIFRQFDIDGDGWIDEGELKNVVIQMGQYTNDDEVRKMFKSADINNDGKISFEEFVTIASANPMILSYKSVFHQLDVDGDGEITKEELRNGFANMGHNLSDKEVDVIFREADYDNDGKINFEEFVQMMSNSKK